MPWEETGGPTAMPTYVQLTDRDALAGKTLERTKLIRDKLFLVFTDASFAVFGVEYWSGDTYNEISLDCTVNFDDLVAMGLVDPGDIAAYKEAERHRQEAHEAAKAARERAEYERLKAKFEEVA
jgi:hypothetical protein